MLNRRGRHPWGPWARRRRLATVLGALVALCSALLTEFMTGLGSGLAAAVARWLMPTLAK